MNRQIAQTFSFMRPLREQLHITEQYVAVPPALTITDEGNNVWTLGTQMAPRAKCPNGEYAFDVVRNGFATGDFASRIERRGGRIRIFTPDGWKRFNGRSFI